MKPGTKRPARGRAEMANLLAVSRIVVSMRLRLVCLPSYAAE
jgi:hypothetical protein